MIPHYTAIPPTNHEPMKTVQCERQLWLECFKQAVEDYQEGPRRGLVYSEAKHWIEDDAWGVNSFNYIAQVILGVDNIDKLRYTILHGDVIQFDMFRLVNKRRRGRKYGARGTSSVRTHNNDERVAVPDAGLRQLCDTAGDRPSEHPPSGPTPQPMDGDA